MNDEDLARLRDLVDGIKESSLVDPFKAFSAKELMGFIAAIFARGMGGEGCNMYIRLNTEDALKLVMLLDVLGWRSDPTDKALLEHAIEGGKLLGRLSRHDKVNCPVCGGGTNEH